jgi:hypothetical protein
MDKTYTYEEIIAEYGEPIHVYIPESQTIEDGEATEYHTFKRFSASGGIIVFAKHERGWVVNPWSIIFLVAHLLGNQKPPADNREVTVDILLEYGFLVIEHPYINIEGCTDYWKGDFLIEHKRDGFFWFSAAKVESVEQLKNLHLGYTNDPLTKPTRCIDRLLGTQ